MTQTIMEKWHEEYPNQAIKGSWTDTKSVQIIIKEKQVNDFYYPDNQDESTENNRLPFEYLTETFFVCRLLDHISCYTDIDVLGCTAENNKNGDDYKFL